MPRAVRLEATYFLDVFIVFFPVCFPLGCVIFNQRPGRYFCSRSSCSYPMKRKRRIKGTRARPIFSAAPAKEA